MVEAPKPGEDARRRLERAGRHQPASHDHQRADRDQRVMAEATESEREPVGRPLTGEREQIKAEGDHADRQQRDDLDAEPRGDETVEHERGQGHRADGMGWGHLDQGRAAPTEHFISKRLAGLSRRCTANVGLRASKQPPNPGERCRSVPGGIRGVLGMA